MLIKFRVLAVDLLKGFIKYWQFFPTFLLLLFFSVTDPPLFAISKNTRNALFKIRVISQEPDFRKPWQKMNLMHSSGSGFYIGQNRIITNAHVVAHSKYITVQKAGQGEPIQAYVSHIAHDCDLAILEVNDQNIFKGVRPLIFGGQPKIQSPVTTVGFPTGGEQLSITKGIVSRIDFRRYVHPFDVSHLIIQVDSAINSGNSGGPVLQDDRIVGVAFQSFAAAENTGYIIPNAVVKRFLVDIEDHKYDGHPRLGVSYTSWVLMNEGTAKYYGLTKKKKGVVISYVAPWSAAAGILQEEDVLISVDGKTINIDGQIKFHGEKVAFPVIVDLKQIGEKVSVEFIRDRKTYTKNIVLKNSDKPNHARYTFSNRAPYIVFGGIVFTILSRSFLESFGRNWYNDTPLAFKYLFYYQNYDDFFKERDEVVVVAGKLPHSYNASVSIPSDAVVQNVNGVNITSLQHLDHVLMNLKKQEKLVRIDFFGGNYFAAFETTNLDEINKEIESIYQVSPNKWLGPFVDGSVSMRIKQ